MLMDRYEGKPCLILFESKRKDGKFYEDIGGHIDNRDAKSFYPLAATAIREAFEESRGLINFTNPLHIGTRKDGRDTFIDIGTKKGKYYRCYIVALEEGSFSDTEYRDFKENVNNLNSKEVPHVFKEMHDVKRFFVEDLVKDGILKKHDHFETSDTAGNKVTIYRRTAYVIQKAGRIVWFYARSSYQND